MARSPSAPIGRGGFEPIGGLRRRRLEGAQRLHYTKASGKKYGIFGDFGRRQRTTLRGSDEREISPLHRVPGGPRMSLLADTGLGSVGLSQREFEIVFGGGVGDPAFFCRPRGAYQQLECGVPGVGRQLYREAQAVVPG